ncbi:OmpA family protein [Chryseolinea sp. H1M3-3]|uniref:OmpA family protein n=1 Tax=Chryseolinea sp. H1M3-3 TaxID=3034144 RepID=UPI0023EBCBDC|nr:OmpA family protein [Chryseolinea sp. H1M3-3]
MINLKEAGKSSFSLCVLILFTVSAYSQSGSIGVYGTLNEYTGDLNRNHYHFYNFYHPKPGAAISLQQYLSPSFNLVEKFSFNQVQYQNDDKVYGVDADFLTLNVKIKYKFNNDHIFKEDAVIAPFLVAGIGGTYIDSKVYTNFDNSTISDGEFQANAAVGAGILFQFSERLGFEISNTLNMPLYDAWDGVTKGDNDVYLQHSAGLVFKLRKSKDTDMDGVSDRKDTCPDTPGQVSVDSKGCPIDSDGDTVADYLDKCPAIAGLSNLEGCPDKDKDNVADINDKCPDVAGAARFNGCPDTDNDGTEDANDRCPNQAGLDIFQGCPDTDSDGVEDAKDKCPNTLAGIKVDETGCPADTDGDGVIDEIDRCPTTPGNGTANGCPEVREEVKKRLNFATRGIYFETGKATLKSNSYAMLNEIISILEEYTDYSLRISGFTDSQGSEATNLRLSQDRVDAVKSYLTRNSVSESRIEATGYGEAKPIATNATATGRAQNRRVELELFLKDQ